MKKQTIMIMLLAAALCLAACSKTPVETVDTTPSTTEATTAPTEETKPPKMPVDQQPMAAISLPVVTESETAEDGTVVFNYTYQNISLIVPDPEVADKVIVDFLNRTDMHDSAESIRTAAIAAYKQAPSYWTPYLSQSVYTPTRIDQSVLSLFGSYVSYDGAAHGGQVSKAVNYDLLTGNVLSWEDILAENVTHEDICRLVLEALAAQEEEKMLFEGYETIVQELFSHGLQHNTDWYLSGNGLCYFFSPYDIGPFSSGTIVAEIPYSSLTGILDDAYFPAERDLATGDLQVHLFEEAKAENFSQFAEVVLEAGTDKILVSVDTSVYDLRLQTGTWSANGSVFNPTATVLAACALTPGDAVMIEAPLADEQTQLRLIYNNGETETVLYIESDAGTVSLTEK